MFPGHIAEPEPLIPTFGPIHPDACMWLQDAVHHTEPSSMHLPDKAAAMASTDPQTKICHAAHVISYTSPSVSVAPSQPQTAASGYLAPPLIDMAAVGAAADQHEHAPCCNLPSGLGPCICCFTMAPRHNCLYSTGSCTLAEQLSNGTTCNLRNSNAAAPTIRADTKHAGQHCLRPVAGWSSAYPASRDAHTLQQGQLAALHGIGSSTPVEHGAWLDTVGSSVPAQQLSCRRFPAHFSLCNTTAAATTTASPAAAVLAAAAEGLPQDSAAAAAAARKTVLPFFRHHDACSLPPNCSNSTLSGLPGCCILQLPEHATSMPAGWPTAGFQAGVHQGISNVTRMEPCVPEPSAQGTPGSECPSPPNGGSSHPLATGNCGSPTDASAAASPAVQAANERQQAVAATQFTTAVVGRTAAARAKRKQANRACQRQIRQRQHEDAEQLKAKIAALTAHNTHLQEKLGHQQAEYTKLLDRLASVTESWRVTVAANADLHKENTRLQHQLAHGSPPQQTISPQQQWQQPQQLELQDNTVSGFSCDGGIVSYLQ